MVKEKRPNLVFLMETKLRRNKMENTLINLGFANMFVVEYVGKSGGLALLWEDGYEMEIQYFSRRHINAIVHCRHLAVKWKFTGFHGHPKATKCHEAWDFLKFLARLAPNPWLCIGDFNKILTMSEKMGGNTWQRNLIHGFQQALEDGALTDLGFYGPKFTWSNCQEGDTLIRELLDRGATNHAWRTIFPDVEVEVCAAISPDHAPLVLWLL